MFLAFWRKGKVSRKFRHSIPGKQFGNKSFIFEQGIWSGMIGGTMMQTLILLWVTFRTDWNKEASPFETFDQFESV